MVPSNETSYWLHVDENPDKDFQVLRDYDESRDLIDEMSDCLEVGHITDCSGSGDAFDVWVHFPCEVTDTCCEDLTDWLSEYGDVTMFRSRVGDVTECDYCILKTHSPIKPVIDPEKARVLMLSVWQTEDPMYIDDYEGMISQDRFFIDMSEDEFLEEEPDGDYDEYFMGSYDYPTADRLIEYLKG